MIGWKRRIKRNVQEGNRLQEPGANRRQQPTVLSFDLEGRLNLPSSIAQPPRVDKPAAEYFFRCQTYLHQLHLGLLLQENISRRRPHLPTSVLVNVHPSK